MTTRSAGTPTGVGFLVGAGYEGKTKELDNAVVRLSKKLEKEFNMEVEIRFNNDRESGGAYIKAVDEGFEYTIGLSAGLYSSKLRKLMQDKNYSLSMDDLTKYPNDLLRFSAVLGEKVSLVPKEVLWKKEYKTITGAVNCLRKYLDKKALADYLKRGEFT